MKRVLTTFVALSLAAPVAAQSAKETDCGHQASVVSAVQAARLQRVSERKVADQVKGAWPDRYNAVVPLVTPWVYQMKMSDVKSADLGAAWKELCLQQ